MQTLQEKVKDFLSQNRIAVAGVSRKPKGDAANIIYLRLKESGYQVYPVNPNAEKVEGDFCYPNLKSLPEKVDGVVISTKPEVADEIVRECEELGIGRVWMHRSFGQGSVSEPAVNFCREKGISVIAGACPMMYCEPVDFAHKCLHWFLRVFGKLPE